MDRRKDLYRLYLGIADSTPTPAQWTLPSAMPICMFAQRVRFEDDTVVCRRHQRHRRGRRIRWSVCIDMRTGMRIRIRAGACFRGTGSGKALGTLVEAKFEKSIPRPGPLDMPSAMPMWSRYRAWHAVGDADAEPI